MGMEDDIRGALTVLQGDNNGQQLPAVRQQPTLPAERTPADDGERVQPRKESLPANREQEQEDERTHPDEQDATQEERQVTLKQERAPLLPVDKAPASWRAGPKEKWPSLDPEVRGEVVRREREMAQALSRTDTERRYASEMFTAIKPYEALLNKLGASHVDAVKHLLEMAHAMHTAPVRQRAELIAELFFRHEVPIELVDAVLVRRLQGQPGQHQSMDPLRQLVQQELAPVREFVQQMAATAQQGTQGKAREQIEDLYADPDIGDMVDEVREDIADLLDLATKRGQNLPLRTAATRAIMAHPEFGRILQQRQLEKQAQQQGERVNRAKRAGASLQDDGAPSLTQDDDAGDGTIGADLLASIRSLNRQQR